MNPSPAPRASLLLLALLAGCGTQAEPRPAAHAQPAPAPVAPQPSAQTPEPAAAPATPWVVQPVAANANPQAASVAAALKSGTQPERLSMMVQPAPFSAEAYARDPRAYLDTVEPGRVFQTAQPGPAVPQLVPAGATAARILPNESTRLSVKTVPNGVVSWTSLDLGSFENSLNAITVAADASGVAMVTFTATSGVSHVVHILAGSPVASGQVSFQVDVQTQGIVPVSAVPASAPTQP